LSTTFVVNADDFGMSLEINAGILTAHRKGIVTSTSVMTNMPHFEAILPAQRQDPGLGVGLHLCISEGRPVLPPARVSTLIDAQGQFHSRAELFKLLKRGEINLRQAADEAGAQADRLLQLGVRTDHWNSHQYVHLHPQLLRVLKATLKPQWFPCMRTHRRAYVKRGGWVRGLGLAGLYGHMPLRLAKDIFFELQHRQARRDGFALPDAQLTRIPFAAAYSVLSENAVTSPPAGVFEWICHPSTTRRSEDRECMDRPGELALLTDPRLAAALRQAGIQLATFTLALTEAPALT
jgi:chitin disaccharide deacetylase